MGLTTLAMLLLQATRTAGSRLFDAPDQDLLEAAAAVIGRRLAALPPLRGAEETRPGHAQTETLAVHAVTSTILAGQNPVDAVPVTSARQEFLAESEAVATAEYGLDSSSSAAEAGVAAEDMEKAAEGGSASSSWEAASFTVSGAGSGLESQIETVTRLETVPEEEDDEELEGVRVQQFAVDSSMFERVQTGSASMMTMANGVLELDGGAARAPAGQLGEAWGWAEAAGLQVDEMFTVARQAEGLFHYAPQEPDELAVRPGQRISLLGLAQPGWYLADAGESRTDSGAAGGRRVGLVPSNFIRLR